MQRENSFEVLDIEVVSGRNGQSEVQMNSSSESETTYLFEECHTDPEVIQEAPIANILSSDEVEVGVSVTDSTGEMSTLISTPVIADNLDHIEHPEEGEPVKNCEELPPESPTVDSSCQTMVEDLESVPNYHTRRRILLATILMATAAVIISPGQNKESEGDRVATLEEELQRMQQLYNQSLIRERENLADSRHTILELQAERLKLHTALSSSQQKLNETAVLYEVLQTKHQELEAVLYSVTKNMQQLMDVASQLRENSLIFPGSHLVNKLLCKLLSICPEPLLPKAFAPHPSRGGKSSCSRDSP